MDEKKSVGSADSADSADSAESSGHRSDVAPPAAGEGEELMRKEFLQLVAEQVIAKKDGESQIVKDLRRNLSRTLSSSSLSSQEAALAAISLAKATGFDRLGAELRQLAGSFDLAEDVLREAEESSALMKMLNVYYRFKHAITEAQGEEAKEHYRRAMLFMNTLGRPVMGKERFEMLAFALSVLNGCSSCMSGHEKDLRAVGVGVEKIHDLARLSAIIAAVAQLDTITASR